MAKELPYFKFEPGAWENGNIQICSFEAQGVFINICSMYWQRLGDLPYALALRKVCGGNASALRELCDNDVLKVIDGMICVDFLNEQLAGFEQTSVQNSQNARAGWEKRRNDASAMRAHTFRNARREEESTVEEKKEEDRTEDNTTSADADCEVVVWPSFEDFWQLYDKKIDRPRCEKRWEKVAPRAREQIMAHLEHYIRATPDKQFRKNPLTYLNNQAWENEVITPSQNGTGKQFTGKTTKQQQVDATRDYLTEHYREKFREKGLSFD